MDENYMKARLSELPYWASLTDVQKETVSHTAVIRHFEKGSLIQGFGDTCLGMVQVITGDIRVYLLSEEGREVTLFHLEKGNPCVLSASCVISQITFDTHITVEKDCDLLIVGAGTYSKLVDENIHVRCFTYELMSMRFSCVMWAMQQILFAKLDRRLASFLLSEYDKSGKREIRMTHEQIARRISSAREVVARMLKRFAADSLVELKRGSIVLTDIDALRNI